jgi:hypothetical protein
MAQCKKQRPSGDGKVCLAHTVLWTPKVKVQFVYLEQRTETPEGRCMTSYIGLDGHSKTSTFVCLNGYGKVVATEQVITCERELLRFVRAQPGAKKLIFEESHMSQWFYALLFKEVDELTVCHPGYLGKKPGAKTDPHDGTPIFGERVSGSCSRNRSDKKPI